MTNEELALRIQAGERELLPLLWEQTHKLIYALFHHLLRRNPATRECCSRAGVTIEDLQQEGYFALLQAVAAYHPTKGVKFVTLLRYPVMKCLFAAIGLRTSRQKHEPLNMADSLDRPVEGGEDITLGDAIADQAAEREIEDILDGVLYDELRQKLDQCLSELTPLQEWAIRQKYFVGHSSKEVAEMRGCSQPCAGEIINTGLRILRKPKYTRQLKPFLKELGSQVYRGSLNRFRNCQASSVELTVELIERERERRTKA